MSSRCFMMSRRYDKREPIDFGLAETETEGVCIRSEDGSLWRKTHLYDFGWGKEHGYERVPELTFTDLFDLLVNSDQEDDYYGAAAVLLERYPEDLLDRCLTLFEEKIDMSYFKDAFAILKLHLPINRCPIKNKPYNEVLRDFDRWTRLSEYVKDNNR